MVYRKPIPLRSGRPLANFAHPALRVNHSVVLVPGQTKFFETTSSTAYARHGLAFPYASRPKPCHCVPCHRYPVTIAYRHGQARNPVNHLCSALYRLAMRAIGTMSPARKPMWGTIFTCGHRMRSSWEVRRHGIAWVPSPIEIDVWRQRGIHLHIARRTKMDAVTKPIARR